MKKAFKLIRVKTHYLVYDGLIPQKDAQVDVVKWINPKIEDYLKLYKAIGDKWGWSGRLLLSDSDLKNIIYSNKNEIWLFNHNGVLKGFFEIDKTIKDKSEIVYLGLLPEEIGKGYGRYLLNAAIRKAAKGNRKVWLHTCEYDHPKALNTYQKAGFVIDSELVVEEYYHENFIKKIENNQE